MVPMPGPARPTPEPPRLPGRALPWLGPVMPLGREPVAFLRAAREHVGDTFAFTLFGRPVAFTCGAHAHEAIFRADDNVLDAHRIYRFMTPVFGPGVAYDAEPEEMQRQISYLLPALTGPRLDQHARVMQEETERLAAGWGEEREVELNSTLNELTVNIATRCLIGEEFQRQMGPELPRLYRDLEAGLRIAGIFHPNLPLPAFRRRNRARAAIAENIRAVMEDRRRSASRPVGTYDDMLDTLMTAHTLEGDPLTDHVVVGILIGMIFAGQHTSTVLAAWTGALLLTHPGHLDQLRAEQEAVLDDGPLSVAQLHSMELLEHCVLEAERLHPPLILLMRKALQEFHIDGYRIAPGTTLLLAPSVSHRLPKVFADPDRFDPARYGPGREEHKNPYNLIGFGGGKHRCIGRAFAYQQVKAIWSVLLRRFEVSADGPPPKADYTTVIPGPVPYCVRFRRRGGRTARSSYSDTGTK